MWPFELTHKRIYKRMGYELDQKEYYFRYLSEIQNWSQHILNTKRFIINSAKRCKEYKTAVVLGSGWCIDVPVMELSRQFEKVYFVDLFHPKKVVQKFSEFKNITFIEEDITKIVADTYNSISRYKNFTVDMLISSPNYTTADYSDILENFDFVVSVNTLAFLDNLILEFLVHKELIDDLASKNLRKFIQSYHLSMLPRNRSCVITPFRIHRYNIDGLEISDKALTYLEPEMISNSNDWIWNFSSPHLTSGSVEYAVKAWNL
ncbi:MAG: hypothetical protein MJ211_06235 [Bacteroidales bacterium]|nr:hypothetical protein [Bacteroidales bacterium]